MRYLILLAFLLLLPSPAYAGTSTTIKVDLSNVVIRSVDGTEQVVSSSPTATPTPQEVTLTPATMYRELAAPTITRVPSPTPTPLVIASPSAQVAADVSPQSSDSGSILDSLISFFAGLFS